MGAIRTSATALLGAGATGAVLALTGPATATWAAAPSVASFGFTVNPTSVAPGGQVVLAVSGCDAASASASSGVFDTVSIARGRTARVTVDRDARRGAQYSVTFTCGGETASGFLAISGATTTPTTRSTARPATGTATATATATATPTGAVAPSPTGTATAVVRGVRGGLGGGAAGTDPLEFGAGAALVLAAAGGAAYAVGRRAAGRRH
ncbi:hypothetical protein [Streptomyces sp. NPDC051567]|uniref:hypothetical protein n=1 Tax=Streptomyces sp. NPDC051567 TaxID=3365660 RepID=UPI00379FD079